MKTSLNKPENPSSSGADGGIIFLRKESGLTSFQALGRIKKVLGTRKVGHTGTLDKFAEGLLILLTGKMTRLNALITGMDKSYEALIRFGRETDTLDPEGLTVAEAPVPDLDTITGKLEIFRGTINQTPPLYSAVHIDGQRAHVLARKGVDAEVPSRQVTIYGLEILSYDAPDLKLKIHCSKGTYIRSLARDLGRACGSRASVQELLRTSIGPFRLEEALRADDFSGAADFYPWQSFFKRLDVADMAVVNEEGIQKMAHGIPFRPEFLSAPAALERELLILHDADGDLKAVLERRNGSYRYKINLCAG